MKRNLIVLFLGLYFFTNILTPFSVKLSADTIKSLWGTGAGIFLTGTTGDNMVYTDSNSLNTVSDNNGGVISVYDGATSTNNFAQRLDSAGNLMWGANGVDLSNSAANTQTGTSVVPDGQGGGIIVWTDGRSGANRIYAQRINAAGTIQWTSGGVQITSVTATNAYITTDMAGGAIISWYDSRSGNNIYAQKIDSTGTVSWAANGVLIGSASSILSRILSDGNGGAYISYVNTNNVKAQRINSSGVTQWAGTGGVTVSGLGSGQVLYDSKIDGDYNFFVSLAYTVGGGNTDIYVQKLNSSGALQWGANGSSAETLLAVSSNASRLFIDRNDIYISFTDNRNTNNNGFVQKFNSSGTAQWTTNGVKLTTGTQTQTVPLMAKEGDNLLTIFSDSRRGSGSIYSQSLNSSGSLLFTSNAYLVYNPSSGIIVPSVLFSDQKGGIFLSTRDNPRVKISKFATVQTSRNTILSDRLSRINESTASSHTVSFLTQTGIEKDEPITITLPVGFTFGGSYDFNDIQLQSANSNACLTATYNAKTVAAAASGTTWGATYSSNTVTIVADTDSIQTDRCIRVILNSNGAGHTITNPSVGADTIYRVALTAGAQTGEAAIIILDDLGTPDSDQIQILGNIDTSISLDLDTVTTNCNNSTETSLNTVNLGVLVPATVKRSDATINFICIDAGTNAGLGLNIYARSNRNNAVGALVSGGNSIASATANLNFGPLQEGYGIRVSSVGTPSLGAFTINSPFNSVTAGSVGQLPGILSAAAQIVDSTGPVSTATASRIAVEVAAKAGNLTLPGNYSDIISFTALVNF